MSSCQKVAVIFYSNLLHCVCLFVSTETHNRSTAEKVRQAGLLSLQSLSAPSSIYTAIAVWTWVLQCVFVRPSVCVFVVLVCLCVSGPLYVHSCVFCVCMCVSVWVSVWVCLLLYPGGPCHVTVTRKQLSVYCRFEKDLLHSPLPAEREGERGGKGEGGQIRKLWEK